MLLPSLERAIIWLVALAFCGVTWWAIFHLLRWLALGH